MKFFLTKRALRDINNNVTFKQASWHCLTKGLSVQQVAYELTELLIAADAHWPCLKQRSDEISEI